MPAEIGEIETQTETDVQQVLSIFDGIRLVFDIDDRHQLSPRTLPLVNVPLKIRFEIFQRALQRLHCAGCECAICKTRPKKSGVPAQSLEVIHLPLAVLDSLENSYCPRQTLTAGRAPAARLLSKKAFKVMYKTNRAGLIVEDNHGPCSQTAACFLHRAKIHLHIQVFLDQEVGRSATRNHAPE